MNYSHLIVGFILLLSACTSANKFNEDAIRQVQTFADERKADAVITYFTHENWRVRQQAAIAFASMHDSLGIEGLLNLSEFDKEPEVRAAAAFALGQYKMRGIVNLLLRRMKEESNEKVKHQLIIAIGKCGGLSELMTMLSDAGDILRNSLAEGVFYGIAQGDTFSASYSPLVSLLEHDNSQFYAAASLARLNKDLSDSKQAILKVYTDCSDEDTRFQLAQILGKMLLKNENAFIPMFEQEKSELVRIGFINGNSRVDSLISLKLLRLALKDGNPHVRSKAAEVLLKLNGIPDDLEVLKLAEAEPNALTKYLLFEAALKFSGSVDRQIRISEQLTLELNKTKDEYIIGFILKALCAWEANLPLVENYSFKSSSILVRGAGVGALLASYQRNNQGNSAELRALLHRGLMTKDVAVAAMCAEAMIDTDYYRSADVQEDLAILESVLASMRLPRDMETYGSILKAMRSLQKRPVSGSLKPDFNHPIDWELALRIPVNQEIKLITNRGEIRIELWINEAPGSVTQFIKLIKNSFYSNKRLHRVVPGFVIQDGCPRGDGYGSTMETVRSEFSPNATFERGTLGFASAGEDTESCQWFITHTRTPHLNGRYTAFGRVVQGMDVVNQLILGDEIKTIELIAP